MIKRDRIKLPTRLPADLSAALNDLGIEHTVSEDEASACCPFHKERRPSWGMSLKTGLWNCFTCEMSGNFPQFVAKITELDRQGVSNWILDRKTRDVATEPINTPARETDTTKIMNEAKLWRFVSPPKWACNKRAITVESCEKYGVLWDRDTEQWIIPIRDPKTNEIWGWQVKDEDGRYFENTPRGVPKSKTLFGLGNFERATLRRPSQAVLVESPLDVCRLEVAGIQGGLAAFGAKVSRAQLRLLARVASSVVLTLDNDDAGERRTTSIIEEFKLIPTFVFAYPSLGKDPGEWSVGSIRRGVSCCTAGELWLRGWDGSTPPWEQ